MGVAKLSNYDKYNEIPIFYLPNIMGLRSQENDSSICKRHIQLHITLDNMFFPPEMCIVLIERISSNRYIYFY